MIDKRSAMAAHLTLFRQGELQAARLVLAGLRTGALVLGLSDDACAAEWALRCAGATFWPLADGDFARCKITAAREREDLDSFALGQAPAGLCHVVDVATLRSSPTGALSLRGQA